MAVSSIIGQLITYLTMPILARIFDPHAFSLYADFFAWVIPLSVLNTLRVEYAIPSFAKKTEQYRTAYDAIIISLINTIIFTIPFVIYTLISSNSSWYYALIPSAALLNSMPQVLFFLVTKQLKTNQTGLYRIINSLANQLLSILFGLLLKDVLGLILGFIIGQLVGMLVLCFGQVHLIWQQRTKFSPLLLLKNYKEFMLFNTPMGVLEVLQISSIILLISYYFGDPFPGYFYLTWRVLQAPINLISNNAYLVNYHHCSELKTKSLPYNKLIIDQFKILFGIAIIISFVIFLFGKEIFSILLGENFSYSGQLAGNLVVLFSMQFAINPFSFVAILENKQRELLIRYGAQFLLNTLCFVVLANLNFNIEITLTAFSVLGAIFHAYNFYWYFKLARNGQ